jgi:DNA-binding transcriptional regulator YhcF (GntR family)
MPKEQQLAGALVLDRLRDRIVAGRYMGYWGSGSRLPSIRDIARAERVDRKTAAAAYQRLQEEGLVNVRPRSGIYLSQPNHQNAAGPLERIYHQWLEHTYDGARKLGLDTGAILHLVGAVAALERFRLPVVEEDAAFGEAMAAELRERLGLRAVAVTIDDLNGDRVLLEEAPAFVATPYQVERAALSANGSPIVEARLTPEILRDLRRLTVDGKVLIVASTDRLALRVRSAVDHCIPRDRSTALEVVAAAAWPERLASAPAGAAVYLWPGTSPRLRHSIPEGVTVSAPERILSKETLAGVQGAILEAAIRRARATPRVQEIHL